MRKAQISLYLILAIVILLGIGLFLYTKSVTTVFIPSPVIPPDTLPIKNYIDSCIENSAKDAIMRMGLQGGYIEIPPSIANVRPSFIGRGINEPVKIPHWYYNGELRIPSLAYMQRELEDHINRSLDVCVQGLEVYLESFEFNFYDREVEVEFGGSHTFINVVFEIEMINRVNSQVTRFRDFQATLPVRMLKVHELAERTALHQYETLFLENVTLEIMTSNFDFPFTGMIPRCGTVRWRVSELKGMLEDYMYYNLPRIRIANTNYVPFLEDESAYQTVIGKAGLIREYLMDANYNEGDPFDDAVAYAGINVNQIPADIYEYTHLFFDVGAPRDGLNIGFVYDQSWDMDFRVDPSDGEIMSTKMMRGPSQFLRFFCLNMYHFAYSIRYPVEVRIVDHQSFPMDGGYVFRFGLPVTIRENLAYRDTITTRMFDVPLPPEREFCNILSEEEVNIFVTGIDEYNYMDQYLPDVNLSYECINHFCNIGSTDLVDGAYKFRGQIPANCVNPFIIAEKEGYLPARQQLTGEFTFINIKKLYTLNVSFERFLYFSADDNLRTTPQGLDAGGTDQSVVLFLSSLDEDMPYEQYYAYPLDENVPYYRNLELLLEEESRYNLNVMYMRGDTLIGGYYNNNLTLKDTDFIGKNEIVIPLVEYRPTPIVRDDDDHESDYAKMMIFLYDGDYAKQLKPRFR